MVTLSHLSSTSGYPGGEAASQQGGYRILEGNAADRVTGNVEGVADECNVRTVDTTEQLSDITVLKYDTWLGES